MTPDPHPGALRIAGRPTQEETAAVLAVLLARPATARARRWRDDRLLALRARPRDPEWCRIVW